MVGVLALQPACDAAASSRAEPASPTATSSTTTPRPSQTVRVTRDDHSGPETCRPLKVGELIVSFFGAFNEGAVDAAAYFSPEMQWYSVSEWTRARGKRHFVSYGYDPAKMHSYFQRRASHNEHLRLFEIDVDFEQERNLGHVGYSLARTADDLPRSRPIAMGKGAIDCDSGTIAVWSMSHDVRFQRLPGLCPGRPQSRREALACTRG